MKVKQKLSLGLGTLFLMIIGLTLSSILLINQLKGDTQNILLDNYNSLDYARKMERALDAGLSDPSNDSLFKENLEKQRLNITETGELELFNSLNDRYESYIKTDSAGGEYAIRKDIADITLLNMQAIQRKSKAAEETANNAISWITVLGTVCFIVAFTLLVNLPGNIANPIRELSASIKQIAAKNYSQRVHFTKGNEFAELAASFNVMAEKLEEYQTSSLQKLMMEKKRIETLINNMQDPVIGIDERDRIIFVNDTALKILGIQGESIVGKLASAVAEKNDLVRTLLSDKNTNMLEPTNAKAPLKIYADGKESYFDKEVLPIKIIPTGETEEKQIGTVILLQNITPYKELDFAKTNFIATISHELKTPISSIKMSLQLLENERIGQLNEEQHTLVESIKDDAGRLLKITAELLNMTQVEAGRIDLRLEAVDPAEIVNYAITANSSLAESKEISLMVEMDQAIAKVVADQEKTAWVLTNLVSNAIRYSYEKSDIKVRVTEMEDKIRFSVEDYGQGIAPEYLSKIFDRYYRVPGSKKEGTGLGLSISKEFIEAQGGKITVESEFGKGTVFSFALGKKTGK